MTEYDIGALSGLMHRHIESFEKVVSICDEQSTQIEWLVNQVSILKAQNEGLTRLISKLANSVEAIALKKILCLASGVRGGCTLSVQ